MRFRGDSYGIFARAVDHCRGHLTGAVARGLSMESINPGMFFAGTAAVVLFGFAGTVGRRYADELRHGRLVLTAEVAAAPAVLPRVTGATGRPALTLKHGGRADAGRRLILPTRGGELT
jgi:hypothetical protein